MEDNTGGEAKVLTQATSGLREKLPAWMQQLPQLTFPEAPNEDYHFVNRQELRNLLSDYPEALKKIEADLDFLDESLLNHFREIDYQASRQQNRYRLYQVSFMLLAALAALFGSFQALVIDSNPDGIAYFSLAEVVIAVFTAFLATVGGTKPPLPLWLEKRRRAEGLRREYFRYLSGLPPYDMLKQEYERRQMLKSRTASICNGESVGDHQPQP